MDLRLELGLLMDLMFRSTFLGSERLVHNKSQIFKLAKKMNLLLA